MPNVKFNLKSGNNPKLIFLIMRLHGRKFRFSTTLKIDGKHWNSKTCRVKKQASVDHKGYNDVLNLLESEALKAHRAYLAARGEGQIEPTFQGFKDFMNARLLRFVGKTFEVNHSIDFFGYVESFIEKRSSLPTFAPGTIVVYNTVLKHLRAFDKVWHRSIDWQSLDLNFATDFQNYLFNEKKFRPNYVNKIIQQLRNFLNAAAEEGIEVNKAYKSRRFQVAKEEVKNIFLTVEELNELYHLNLPPGLSNARDLFIIGAFTGLRFSDFTKIKPENISIFEGTQVIKIDTTKTGTPVSIPIHPFVKAIFAANNGKAPYPISNQKMNEFLKDIAAKCNWAKLPGIKNKFKCQDVSTHTARRSFATNAFLAGVPVISIMKITGHKTEKQFMKYIAISSDVNAKIISDHQFFKELVAIR